MPINVKRTSSAYLIALIALLASLLAAIFYYPMTWGLMDDSQTLHSLAHEWSNISLFHLLRDHPVNVIFRPVYVAFLYLGYGFFQHSPKMFYVFVYGLVLLSILPWV